MPDSLKTAHPYAGVDIAGLDLGHAALLSGAMGLASDAPPSQGLALRERWLFRFGGLAGKGEWTLNLDMLGTALDSGFLDPGQALLAAREAIHVLGLSALARLAPFLSRHGLVSAQVSAQNLAQKLAQDLADPAAALLRWLTATPPEDATGPGLTERDVFALGLGLTWGARCWET